MTVTVVSTASDGSKVNEGRVGDTGGECPDGWRERDGFFYYLERRRHLVVGVRESVTSWLVVVNSGTVRRRMSITGLLSDLFYQLSIIRLPTVLRILRRCVPRRVQVPHPKIFPIIAFHESPESQPISHSFPVKLQPTRTDSSDSRGNPCRGSCTV